jgi:hypothetical protein
MGWLHVSGQECLAHNGSRMVDAGPSCSHPLRPTLVGCHEAAYRLCGDSGSEGAGKGHF